MTSRASRVSVGLLVVGGLVWAVSSLANTESHQPASHRGGGTQPAIESPSDGSPQLAGRYHLRQRSTRFFKRSSGWHGGAGHSVGRHTASVAVPDGRLAGRYHLRSRTNRFFGRSKSPELAARYHLRSRTERFFQRAVG